MASGPMYQYGTSPRKVQYQEKNTIKFNRLKSVRKETSGKKKKRTMVNTKQKFILYLIAAFSIVLIVSYRNSLITEEFNIKEKNKKQLGALEKENEQLKVSIESSLNLNNIAAAAKEQLGMQKLDNSQKIYISLPKKDYVEPASEEVVIHDDAAWYKSIINKFIK